MKKINQILQKWPQGTVVTTDWLKKQGMSRQSVNNYKKSGWLEQISSGAYKRKGDSIKWQGGVYALQQFQNKPVHIGGKTSLELQGYGHYIRQAGQQKVVLWKIPQTQLPMWFQNVDWEVQLNVRSATLFREGANEFLQTKVEHIPLTLSTAERAILEYLYDVPKHEGFDEASYIMEGLTSLRPTVLQSLLEACNSVRVKRVFMFIAEYYQHSWWKRLNHANINFGKGKRVIVEEGKLNKKYMIVVPELGREDQR